MLRIVWCWTYRRLGCHRLDRSGRVYTRHTSILWLWCSCRSTHATCPTAIETEPPPLKVKARLSLPCLTLTLHHNQGNQSWQEEQEWQAPPHSQLKNELGCETLCYCTCFSLVLCVSGNGGISFSPVVVMDIGCFIWWIRDESGLLWTSRNVVWIFVKKLNEW